MAYLKRSNSIFDYLFLFQVDAIMEQVKIKKALVLVSRTVALWFAWISYSAYY